MVGWNRRRTLELQEGMLRELAVSGASAALLGLWLGGCASHSPSHTSSTAETRAPTGLLAPSDFRQSLPNDDFASQGVIPPKDLKRARDSCTSPARGAFAVVDKWSDVTAEEVSVFRSESGVTSVLNLDLGTTRLTNQDLTRGWRGCRTHVALDRQQGGLTSAHYSHRGEDVHFYIQRRDQSVRVLVITARGGTPRARYRDLVATWTTR